MTYEQWLAALCVWREARGEAYPVKLGIWWVIQNRMADEQRRWPRTVAGVILQHRQFSSFNAEDPNVTRFPVQPTPTQPYSADWQAFGECQKAVSEPAQPDPANGANFYESEPTPPDPAKAPWFDPKNLVAHIGTVRFYRS